ncbi:alpha/beta fold hydrolase [Sphingomonas bacterium]|uniref:alpha/beta fold hydrolase n=1 Tax=Sphingomonas bacterium TaxID=1895847 RepID=UPI0015764FAF|nr:alpha/beta fold hydrolase [Sphingomonas bacterium]
MITLILVAGAMHSARSWRRVIPLLEARGVGAFAIDLPGLVPGSSTRPEEVTLAMWGDHVAGHIRGVDGPVILVGHSRGGLVVGEVAERLPERLAGLIHVCALIVPPGRTALEVMGPQVPGEDGPTPAADGKTIGISAEAAKRLFYNRCSEEDAADAVAHLLPEPAAPNATPTTATAARWGRVPRAYVETADDNNLDLAKQRSIKAAAPCDPVVTLDADHSPFLSAAPELAEALFQIAAGFVREAEELNSSES